MLIRPTPRTTSPPARPRAASFTLIELVVAIVVVGILASLATVTYRGVVERTTDAANEQTLASVLREASMLAATEGGHAFTVEHFEHAVGDLNAGSVAFAAGVSAAAGDRYEVVFDDGTDWTYSSRTGEIHVALSADGRRAGVAMVSRHGKSCVFGRIAVDGGGLETWRVLGDLQAACSGRAGEAGDRTPDPLGEEEISAPPQIVAAATAGDRQVTITWGHVGIDNVTYRVEVRDGDNWDVTATYPSGQDVYSHDVTGLTNDVTYDFRVVAYNLHGTLFDEVSATPYDDTAPAAPVVTLTQPNANNTQLVAAWDPVDAADLVGYRVSVNGGPETFVAADGTLQHNVAGSWGLSYTVAVTAVDDDDNVSAPGSAALTLRPAAPTLSWSSPSSNSIALSWTASPGASGYRVYRGGQLLQTLGGTSATDSGLAAATSYSYTVVAYNAGGESPASNTVSALTRPAAPTVTVSCPTGYYDNFGPERDCVIQSSSAGATSYSGSFWAAGGYAMSINSSYAVAVNVPPSPAFGGVGARVAACNSSGCSAQTETLSVAQPRPSTPSVVVGDCGFGHCNVHIAAWGAWTYEVQLYGGPDTGVLRVYDAAAVGDGWGPWPVGYDDFAGRYYSEKPNQNSGLRSFHISQGCDGFTGGCTRTLIVPQGALVRVSGTNGFAGGATLGWVNDGWCLPPSAGASPNEATCNFSVWVQT